LDDVVKEKEEKALAEHVARHPEDVGRTVEDFKWILWEIVRSFKGWGNDPAMNCFEVCCHNCGQLGTAADPLHDRPDGVRLHGFSRYSFFLFDQSVMVVTDFSFVPRYRVELASTSKSLA
jgi:hypothetical protein